MAISAPKSVNKSLLKPIGVSGLGHSGGVIDDEFLPELRGPRGMRAYREMLDNDATVGAVMLAITLLIRQVEMDVVPADQSNEAMRAHNLVDTAIKDMETSWENFLSECLSFLGYGWSVSEKIYKMRFGPNRDPGKSSLYNDGMIGWADWAPRAQTSLSRWKFEGDRMTGMYQNAGGKEVLIPRERMLHFKTTSNKGSPEGRSILRNSYKSYFFKKNLEVIEGIGVERDLAGIPVAYVPPELLAPDADPEMREVLSQIQQLVRNIRRNEQEGAIFPMAYDEQGRELWRFQLLTSGGSRQFETSQIIDRYDVRILMSLLADFIMLGHDQHGSFALSSSKTNLFAIAIGAWLDIICEEINRSAIRDLILINGMPIEVAPKLTYKDIETLPLEELGSYIERLTRAGMTFFPDPETENHLRKQAGLPMEREQL
jgi:hypothetical protein